ncbi:hypothetical protein ACFWWA_31245 [Streptomyces goshikiensis]|uniref:hypothetical protein n=1 Tax=Streptomyces goshikiensis TaxID=1942 RepID=UPI0036526F34
MPATAPRESHTTDLDAVAALAARHGVPIEDALLIAINLHGISSPLNRHRARVLVRLASAPTVPWQVIVPLNASASPFVLDQDTLLLGGIAVATVTRVDADEAVGGYFRNNGRAATLNPNARSRCVGCAFCPNTLEAAADPRLSEQRAVRELLDADHQPLRRLGRPLRRPSLHGPYRPASERPSVAVGVCTTGVKEGGRDGG